MAHAAVSFTQDRGHKNKNFNGRRLLRMKNNKVSQLQR